MGITVITHRGLEPSKKDFFPESSYESFKDQIERGFGIEFDPNFCKDGIIVWHDSNLKRITREKDEREFSGVSINEVFKIVKDNWNKGRISLFSEVLELIEKSQEEDHALHLKGINQEKEKIDLLIEEIKNHPKAIEKLIIFDVKPEFARYIKSKMREIKLAPSVAHEYDIKRYNNAVLGTLISIDDAIKYKKEGLYEWVWLDEWDRIDKDGTKKFYNAENFKRLRDAGYKIALVTPELHRKSPGLLGGEKHSDSENEEILFKRIGEIILLKPDAICTDYPEEARQIIKG